jgi:peptidoglycan/LPS O-acetylase OafA/YrhL
LTFASFRFAFTEKHEAFIITTRERKLPTGQADRPGLPAAGGILRCNIGGYMLQSVNAPLVTFNQKNNSLNLVRLVLAICVLVSHSFTLGGFGKEPNFENESLGGWGVIGFFCISGYLITASRETLDFGSFLVKRIVRLFPAYCANALIVVLLFAPIAQALQHGAFSSAAYISTEPSPLNYIMSNLNPSLHIGIYAIGDTLIDIPHPNAWNGSLWSLEYEFLSYLIIAVLFCFVKKHRFITVLIMWAGLSSLNALIHVTGILDSGGMFAMLIWLFSIFVGGSLTFFILKKVTLTGKIALPSLVIAILLLTATPLSGACGFGFLVPFFTYFILWLANTVGFGKLGSYTRTNDISYGVYIYAFPIQQLTILLASNTDLQFSIYSYIAITIVICFIFATASWFFVERPAMRFASSRLKK